MKRFLIVLLCLLLLVGCAPEPTPVPMPAPDPIAAEKVEISATALELYLGDESVSLSYVVTPALASVRSYNWASSDETVATVDKGVITPVGEGECTVSLTLDNGVSASASVTVIDPTYFAPAIAFNENDGCTYIDGVLIVNKSYPLPEGYEPGGLLPQVQRAFNDMVAAAKEDGVSLWIVSGYRSYETQRKLYNNYVATYGKASADTYSARPGHSEHQTGLAFDVNTISYSFGTTSTGKWLQQNGATYGFIIRYPEGKQSITGYIYEPWHLRYLGTELATKVVESGLCLEEYFNIDSVYQE